MKGLFPQKSKKILIVLSYVVKSRNLLRSISSKIVKIHSESTDKRTPYKVERRPTFSGPKTPNTLT